MSDIQNKLGTSLILNLVKLRQEKGGLSIEDAGALFMQMASTLTPGNSEADKFVHTEIKQLSQYIAEAKKELLGISTNGKEEKALIEASEHLGEVVKATEKATTRIMDAADKIQSLATGMGGDRAKEIVDETSAVYEACNFQDITGQRINNVIALLTAIEKHAEKLNDLFGIDVQTVIDEQPKRELTEADLLNGPQLPGDATSQEDVDALFASLNAQTAKKA